jgi:hypothetical protein
MVEVILTHLSLVELARIFMTCRSFYAVYRMRMKNEQKSRCDLAYNLWGRARLASLVTLITNVVEGKRWHADFAMGGEQLVLSHCYITEDGLLHKKCSQQFFGSSSYQTPRDIDVSVLTRNRWPTPISSVVLVGTHVLGCVLQMQVWRN